MLGDKNQYEKTKNKNKPNGYAGLDELGNIKLSEILIWLEGI